MGLPDANAAGYKLGSSIHYADGLKGNLLIVHGSGDDNVHVQGTEKLVNRLIELGKPFDADDLPEPLALDFGGVGHDRARLPQDRPLLPRSPVARPSR